MGGVPFLPDQASSIAGQVDTLFLVLIVLSALFAIPVCLLIIFFAVKYRRGSRADRTPFTASTLKIELAWSLIPLALALGVFVWAARLYFTLSTPPQGAMEIYVVGRQWMWEFQHPEGQRELNELHVPLGRPIKLTMTSADVIHDLYVPAFRVKRDVVPGRYSTLWFQATQPGEYHLFCTEYCGLDHSVMGGTVYVLEPAQYEAWLDAGTTSVGNSSAGPTLAAAGQQLFTRLGCSGCHRMDGSGTGPSLAGVYGKQVPLTGGQFATADDQYIRDSILLPQQQIVAGYGPVMPSFQGQVSEGELLQLIAYIKSLSNSPTAPGMQATSSASNP